LISSLDGVACEGLHEAVFIGVFVLEARAQGVLLALQLDCLVGDFFPLEVARVPISVVLESERLKSVCVGQVLGQS